MKHTLLVLLACLLTASLLVGCGAAPAEEKPAETTAAAAPVEEVKEETEAKEEVELYFLTSSMYLSKANAEINESLQKQYPYLSVNIEHVADNYEAVLKTKLQTGGAPDIYNFPLGAGARPFVDGGQAMDLSDTGLDQLLLPNFVEMGKFNGKLYSIPIALQFSGLLYNKDCFEKAGIAEVPQTTAELKDAVDKLNAAGIQPFASGMKDQWVCYQVFWHSQAPYMDMPQWYEDMNAGTGSFDTEGSRQFFGEVFDLFVANAGPNPLSNDFTTMCQELATGKAAMSILGDFAYAEMMKFNPDAKLGLAGVPVTDNPEDAGIQTNCTGTYVSTQCEHKEAAIDFLRWALSKEGAALMAKLDGCGTTAASDPELNLVGFAADGMEWVNAGKPAREAAWDYWASGIMDVVGKNVQSYYAGMMTLDELYADLDANWVK